MQIFLPITKHPFAGSSAYLMSIADFKMKGCCVEAPPEPSRSCFDSDELLFPLIEIGKRLVFLAEWDDPVKSYVFLLCFLYIVYRTSTMATGSSSEHLKSQPLLGDEPSSSSLLCRKPSRSLRGDRCCDERVMFMLL